MLWLCFIIGQGLNILRQSVLVAGSSPNKNPIASPWRWIYRNAVGLAIREVAAITFWLGLIHPVLGPAIIAHWKPEYAQYARFFREIPFFAVPFGMVFSIGFDFGLEKWSWLKSKIPPLGE